MGKKKLSEKAKKFFDMEGTKFKELNFQRRLEKLQDINISSVSNDRETFYLTELTKCFLDYYDIQSNLFDTNSFRSVFRFNNTLLRKLAEDIDDLDIKEIHHCIQNGESINDVIDKNNPSRRCTLLLIFIILQIGLPITNNIVANLTTPLVSAMFKKADDVSMSQREANKNVRRISTILPHIRDTNWRFIGRDDVLVRSGPGKKYEPIAVLENKSAVELLETNKAWSKIRYIEVGDNDNETIGWVFSSFVDKFR